MQTCVLITMLINLDKNLFFTLKIKCYGVCLNIEEIAILKLKFSHIIHN